MGMIWVGGYGQGISGMDKVWWVRNEHGDMHGQEIGMVGELVKCMGTNVNMVDGNIAMRENGYDKYGFVWGYGYENGCEDV